MEATRPDQYTGAWYRIQFDGITHRLNQQSYEQSDHEKKIQANERRIAALEASLKERDAKIGELMDKHARLVEHLKTKFAELNGKK